MKWFVVFFVMFFSCPKLIVGQDSVIIGNEALNKIYEINDPLFFDVQPLRKTLFLKETGVFEIHSQSLLKGQKDFFIRTDGTGRIYQIKRKSNDSLFLKRIDSTHFYGYNGWAFEFIYNDTIMSLGGFGFWRKNGHLRYFSKKNKEWDIIPLNIEVPITKECVYFDTSKNEIYFLTTPHFDPATKKSFKEQNIFKLSLESRCITLLGSLNKEQAVHYPTGMQFLSLQIPSLKAELVVFNGNNIYLYDFINNEIYTLKNPAIEKTIFSSSIGGYLDILFEKDGKLFYAKSNDPNHHLDSIPISLADFTKLNQQLYTPDKQLNTIVYWIGSFLFVSILFFVYWEKSKRKSSSVNEDISFYEEKENKFKENEIDLIEKIYNRSLEGKSYSVEDINAALGLSKKSLEIQKKIRTETINRINHRFKIMFNTEDELIERIRLEEDRRFYKYIISEENGKKALGI